MSARSPAEPHHRLWNHPDPGWFFSWERVTTFAAQTNKVAHDVHLGVAEVPIPGLAIEGGLFRGT